MLITIYPHNDTVKEETRRLYVESVDKIKTKEGAFVIQPHWHTGARDRFIFQTATDAARFYEYLINARRRFRDNVVIVADRCSCVTNGREVVKIVEVYAIVNDAETKTE